MSVDNVALNINSRMSPVLQGVIGYLDVINAGFARTQSVADDSGTSMAISFEKGLSKISEFSAALESTATEYETQFRKMTAIAFQNSMEISNQINLNLDFTQAIESANELKAEIIPILGEISAAVRQAESASDPGVFEQTLSFGKKVKETYDVMSAFGKIMQDVTKLFPGFSSAARQSTSTQSTLVSVTSDLTTVFGNVKKAADPMKNTLMDIAGNPLTSMNKQMSELPGHLSAGAAATLTFSTAQTALGASSTAAAGGINVLTAAVKANPIFWGAAALSVIASIIMALNSLKSEAVEASEAVVNALSVSELQDKYDDILELQTKGMFQTDVDNAVALLFLEQLTESADNAKEALLWTNIMVEMFPELSSLIDESTGAFKDNSISIEENIEMLHRLAEALIKVKMIEKSAELIAGAELSAMEYKKKYNEQKQIYDEALKTAGTSPRAGIFGANSLAPFVSASEELKKAEESYKESVKKAEDARAILKDTFKELVDLDVDHTLLFNNSGKGGVNLIGDRSNDRSINISGGRIDSVGRIESEIDISEEDARMLKDIASQEYSISYAQLTPQMTVTFGDVRETADVESIMTSLTDMMEEAMQSTLIGGAA